MCSSTVYDESNQVEVFNVCCTNLVKRNKFDDLGHTNFCPGIAGALLVFI